MRETEPSGNVKRKTGNVPAETPTFHASRFTFHGLERLLSTVRRVCGMPDYDRYLEHQRACHHGEPVLSRKEHYLEFVQRRYAGGGSRCC